MYRAPLVQDNQLKRPSDLQLSGELNPCSNSVKRQRVTHDQTGLPAISNCSELDKEICGLAPIVRCSQNGKPSKSCTGEDATKQDIIHLGEGYQPVLPGNPVPLEVEEDGGCLRASCCIDVQTARITAQVCARRRSESIMSGQRELEGDIRGTEQINYSEDANSGSPKNEGVTNKQQVRVSEEATEPPSSDISKRISLVETIYSKRIEKLLANQSKKSLQFKEARDRIKNDLTQKLLSTQMHQFLFVRCIPILTLEL
ncbi:uncharacterized protein LOC113339983 [Papaver somniferum]|uniref:uncharacterized protein LOC113339983 n=1 Tax=Papaver somniferum TaxID=3469 RepID=UPI000E700F6D|nr:uncharacterized protein LOC113339983 [Papaver somniferum]